MKNKENSSSSITSANLDCTKPCWYWDKDDLAHTPSQIEGLDPATEARYRREGARFIFDMSTSLGLHYETPVTGIIYFHRFYMFRSFQQFPRYITGASCLFLAGKVEETPKKCKDIIRAAQGLLDDVQFGQFGDNPTEEVMVLERILLLTIKFDLQVEHPHQYLLKYTKQLKGEKNKIEKLVQMAWTFVNDSFCTTLSLQWEPEIIAVAVMYLVERLRKFKIRELTSKPMGRWWEQFVQDVPVDVLEDICHQILDLYSQGTPQMPHHTPHQLQQPPSLQPAPQVTQSQPSPGSEEAQPQQKESQQSVQQQQPKPSPPGQAKGAMVVAPKEEDKATESPPPKLPPVHLPPDLMPPLVPAVAAAPVEASYLPKLQIPPPALQAPVYEPPPWPHWPPPPLSPNYITRRSTTSSYMSEDYQSLQSTMKTELPSCGALGPAYGPALHLPYHPHAYPRNPPPCPVPPPADFFPSCPIAPLISGYPPPPFTHTPNFLPPPSCLPPTHVLSLHLPPGLGLPPASHPPPGVPPGGQSLGPPPTHLPGMLPVWRLGQAVWKR